MYFQYCKRHWKIIRAVSSRNLRVGATGTGSFRWGVLLQLAAVSVGLLRIKEIEISRSSGGRGVGVGDKYPKQEVQTETHVDK